MSKESTTSFCKYCGATFEQRQSKGRKSEFCSEECRRAQHYLNRKMNVDPNKKVSHAGVQILQDMRNAPSSQPSGLLFR